MKLLAKTAEERYQSASGLEFDLENCLEQIQKTGQKKNFTPGQRERKGQLLIPQKLYGREAEVATLMATFERVSTGGSEMMLIAGYSGIGKSALVNEVHKPIVQVKGYFIAGKFDQFQRSIPYAALIQACCPLKPGTLAIKAVASFQNLKVLMKDGAILFGSTILGPENVKYNWLNDLAIRFYEKKGFVNNLNDNLADLEAALASNFSSYSVRVIGYIALFTARK